ncbi:head maturation protease, ClpP-related [Marisediminicola sp. LYQ134]|uniref:head maturation protease, ClpP-related n=1 Tax=Marisediminicola sp. LYQ134 TaxID=3391061 RepID=UPI003983180E
MRTTPNPTNRYWGNNALPKTKAEFFNAVTTPLPGGEGTIATIRMYGPIDSWGGYWGISTKDIGEVLDALPDSVTQIILRINSPGGEVFEGVSILNMLRAHKATITAVVDGLAASAASFIAAGCDDTVMSPGTQMMIHSPSGFTWGNAAELRKDADVLDSIEASIVEIYTEKAGDQGWTALLAAETWLTAAESVELGIADRIAVIPDAGESTTVGEEDPILILPIEVEDSAEAVAAARVAPIRAKAAAAATNLPSSTEPDEPNRKENAVAYSDLTAGLRERLGVNNAAVTDDELLEALDETLAERAEPTIPAAPEGTVLVDAAVWEDVQAKAQLGAAARAEQESTRRDGIIRAAIEEGRISPANQEIWRAQLDKDETGTTAQIATLAKNATLLGEIGRSDEIGDADTALYSNVYPAAKKES